MISFLSDIHILRKSRLPQNNINKPVGIKYSPAVMKLAIRFMTPYTTKIIAMSRINFRSMFMYLPKEVVWYGNRRGWRGGGSSAHSSDRKARYRRWHVSAQV